MNNLLAIIFDADGTILDSMYIWHELGGRYLRSIDVEPERNLAEILYPLSLEQGCVYLKERYALEQTLPEIREGIVRIIQDFYIDEVGLKAGIRNFLQSMLEKDIPMVIATSGDRTLLNAALERNGIAGYFNAVFTCSELETNKHEPKIYLECAKFFGLEPYNIAVFEDSLFALETAKAAGFITFGVEDDSNINDRERIIEVADFYTDFC
ncbi:MAG: HAD family phosphatase [Synergistales bacterium]|nr:HAD family phosphatase [Synergistales bacterium]MDY6402349.1 HAD family phosphatase [Synergistales bacterium]MDY6404474.1 HAD family phosphatase [Synergistales bacterium]MDY6410546.1 HAD family phosphatase [Synergistales bacterium]MDY6413782.1 HAD family phosphatase [Synergistales bacterium]